MSTVMSKDGTEIAYEKKGAGPAVLLVDPALCYRSFGPMQRLSELLSASFTVYTYDRRGRGESGNSKPYTVKHEIEDINAIVNEAGGSVFLYGTSSGACLAIEAATELGEKISKLALYEPPYDSNKSDIPAWKNYQRQLKQNLAARRYGKAVELFMRFVGTPDEAIEGMRHDPSWAMLEAVAPTLAYDAAAMGKDRRVPVKKAASINAPVLIMDGEANHSLLPFMHESAISLASALPKSRQCSLKGQTHDVSNEVIAPVLEEFFNQEEENL